MEVRIHTPHGHTFFTTPHQARDVELGRLGRQLDRNPPPLPSHTFSSTPHQARDVELGRLGRQLDRSPPYPPTPSRPHLTRPVTLSWGVWAGSWTGASAPRQRWRQSTAW